jgi:ABC-type transport system substrate-binding protein
MSEAGQLMMWGLGWTSGVPDGIDFYSYFYSKNIGTSNDARMRLPAFDALYEKARNLPDGPPRTALFDEMNDLVFNYAPWILGNFPVKNVLAQPWLKGYKLNTFVEQQWRYLDVAPRR